MWIITIVFHINFNIWWKDEQAFCIIRVLGAQSLGIRTFVGISVFELLPLAQGMKGMHYRSGRKFEKGPIMMLMKIPIVLLKPLSFFNDWIDIQVRWKPVWCRAAIHQIKHLSSLAVGDTTYNEAPEPTQVSILSVHSDIHSDILTGFLNALTYVFGNVFSQTKNVTQKMVIDCFLLVWGTINPAICASMLSTTGKQCYEIARNK